MKSSPMNIIEKTDEEIFALANPMWASLVKSSNDGNYADFVKGFSDTLMRALNDVEIGRQFTNSELSRNLADDAETLGIIRRGEHVTVLYKQRSTVKDGDWLGRLVLGYEEDELTIFGASIF